VGFKDQKKYAAFKNLLTLSDYRQIVNTPLRTIYNRQGRVMLFILANVMS
jgi:hypothetical protein